MSEQDILVTKEIEKILVKVCEVLNWTNYEIDSGMDHELGNGFLGEFYLTTLTNKDTKQKVDVALKKAFKNPQRREMSNTHTAYVNEIHFYSKVFPVLEKFQREKSLKTPFTCVPKFLYGNSTEPNEFLVMENIKSQNYVLFDKKKLLDEDHTKFIFEHYGRFHALSFALKDQNPKDYEKLSDGMLSYFKAFAKNDACKYIQETTNDAFKCCDQDVKDYGEIFSQNCAKIFEEVSTHYPGKYDCLIHGDCWSNNMMFRYKDSKLDDMKLIDFQLIAKHTPVLDLSYFFYAGGSKKLFDKLDDFLKVYYDSFSKFLRELGSDPTVMYPFEELKTEWKIYSKFGICMSLMLTKIKLYEKEEMDKLTDDSKSYEIEEFKNLKLDTGLYEERVRDILRHAMERDLLT